MKRYEICGTFMHGGSGGGGRFSDGGGVGSAGEDLAALPSDDGLSEEPGSSTRMRRFPEALKEVGTRFADEKSGMEAEAGLFS